MRSIIVVSDTGAGLVQITVGMMRTFSLMITVMMTSLITVTMLETLLDVSDGSDVVEGQTSTLTSSGNGDWRWG